MHQRKKYGTLSEKGEVMPKDFKISKGLVKDLKKNCTSDYSIFRAINSKSLCSNNLNI